MPWGESPRRADPDPHQIVRPPHDAAEAAHGERGGHLSGKQGDQHDRREHPDDAERAPEPGARRLVAVADRGHGHRSPPEPVADSRPGRGRELLRVGAALDEPDQDTRHEEQADQHADGLHQPDRGEASQRVEPAAAVARAAADGDHELARVVWVAELNDRLAIGAGRRRRHGEQPAALQAPGKLGDRQLAELEPQPQLGGNRSPQVDRDTLPGSLGIPHREGRRRG